RKTSGGSVEYAFSHGVTTAVMPPDNPINARHAELFEDLGPPPDTARKPENHPPEPPSRPEPAIGRNGRRPNRPGARTKKPGEQSGSRGRRPRQAGGPNRSGRRGNRSTPGRASKSARSTGTPANHHRSDPAVRVGRRAGVRQYDGATMKSSTSAT